MATAIQVAIQRLNNTVLVFVSDFNQKDMKKIFTYLIICFIAVVFFACNKDLSAPPKNAKVEGNTIIDQSTAQIALNGVYYNFAFATATTTGWQMHEVFPASLAGYIHFGFGNSPSDLNQNSIFAANPNYWLESYQTINAANGLIKGVNDLADGKFTANRKAEMIAEAHFLRAYSHFKILNYYGEWYKPDSKLGIVLRDEPSVLSAIPKARSSVKDSYAFIISDLDDAIANAPVTNPVYYATKWAAMAMKIRVLICRGGTGDYASVISLANTIIQSSPYVLEAKQEDVFHTKGLASKEVILGIQPQALQVSYPYNKSRQYYPLASNLWTASQALRDIYANDPRLTWMIGTPTPYIAYSPGTSYFMKYILQGGTPNTLSESDYALRLTEVYLLEAEALVRSGGDMATVKMLVHTIQSKAGITATVNNTNYLAVESANTADLMLMEIYKETVRSLIGEDGAEWNALLRLPLATVQQIKPTITSQNLYIFPVPPSEFLYNPLFGDQNPGYIKN
ncbi:RagB/SusD family nutrient uptake outer membrane protein [Mucilaginibacter sp. ZT4R22]|uniref:RagB/SusD family nutrient uptake outer membrane protein n=1 Tax=Mucilaginibacter pankratovii TaxID=2772110 RepID=A0ABR7WWD8_9SPHI|nr:RagB/SusD family nutrient uptake outer membrane protein [Mucilaginibacter pankratovii]MBD1366595.1 RagB/SusD family nutrient uptake outer membrane protein [Mucilaginibacter pankratovii]